MAAIVCVGEAMLELSRGSADWTLGTGGDTFNTAVHLARAGHNVAYFTAVGVDPFSDELIAQWRGEGIDCSLVLRHPVRNPGLYAISTDARGERSFTYWRDNSAAREMFDLAESTDAVARASRADLMLFSLISLAILPPGARDKLLELTTTVRAGGGRIAFDSNYRARLWTDAGEARAARNCAIRLADIGLPTFEDEQSLSDDSTPEQVGARWRDLGCEETIVKMGAAGCMLPDGSIVPPEQQLDPVDTSGAGDAFNAGYLDARLSGASIQEAARAGHERAAWTIMRPGAIPHAG